MTELVYSIDSETFNYDSIDEAIMDDYVEGIMDDYVEGELGTVYSGVPIHYKASDFYTTDPVDYLHELAYEEMGEHTIDWPNVYSSVAKELSEAIKSLIDDWATLNDVHPKFFSVHQIREIPYKVLEDGSFVLV